MKGKLIFQNQSEIEAYLTAAVKNKIIGKHAVSNALHIMQVFAREN